MYSRAMTSLMADRAFFSRAISINLVLTSLKTRDLGLIFDEAIEKQDRKFSGDSLCDFLVKYLVTNNGSGISVKFSQIVAHASCVRPISALSRFMTHRALGALFQ